MIDLDALGQAATVNVPAAELCGGIGLGNLSFKPRHWFGSKNHYSESVSEYGYKTNSWDRMLERKISDFTAQLGWFPCVPKSLSIDGRTHRIYSVTGSWVGNGEFYYDDDLLEKAYDTVSDLQTTTGMQFYTPRNPAVDSRGGRTWMCKFIDTNRHTCYARLLLRHLNGMAYSILNNDGYQMYEKEVKTEFWVTIWDVDCASNDVRESVEELYASIKKEALTKLTSETLYNNIKDCIAILADLDGGKATGFLARGKGQVYLYTNRHIAQQEFNNGADPYQSATTISGEDIRLGRLQIPLFKGDRYDVSRYELVNPEQKAIDLIQNVSIDVGNKVFVLGNSGAEDVVTVIEGKVIAVGPDKFEIDAKFLPGNSGSPVFNEMGQLIGIASYIVVPKKSIASKGTRFEQIRYFVARVDCLPQGFGLDNCWYRVGRDKTNDDCAERRLHVALEGRARRREVHHGR